MREVNGLPRMSKVWGSMPNTFKRVTALPLKSLPSSLNSREHQHQLASDAVFGEARSHQEALGTGRRSFSRAERTGEGRTEGPRPRLPAARCVLIKMHVGLRAVVTDSHLGLCSTAPGERQGGGATLWQSLCSVIKPPRSTPGVQGKLTISCFGAWAGVLSKGPAG